MLFAGGDVNTTVKTPRDPRNRELRVIVEAADYYASSDVQIDGVDGAATHQFTWKSLPGGAYRVEAILLREDGAKETFTSCFAVLGDDDGDTGIAAPSTRRRRAAPPSPPGFDAGQLLTADAMRLRVRRAAANNQNSRRAPIRSVNGFWYARILPTSALKTPNALSV